MKRSKPLARGTRLKAKRATPRKSGRVHDEAYLAAVRELPCYACGKPGPSDPDHQGERPLGRKASDDTAVPMCRPCHQKRTDGYVFTAWGSWMKPAHGLKQRNREWCDAAIAATRAIVLPMLGRDVEVTDE